MRSHGSSLWGFGDNILQGWFKTSPYLKYPTTLRSVGSLVLSQSKQEIAKILAFWDK